MTKIILYIASSLDGFIARPDGNLDWLNSVPLPNEGDYGYSDLLKRIGTLIMGRKTYDEVIGFGIDWPYTGINSYVVTSDKNLKIQSPDTQILTKDLHKTIIELKEQSDGDIWLVGGGKLITSFLNLGLLDRMIITIIPKILGEGIPLFASKHPESDWKLITADTFETGVINLTYEKVE